MGNSLTCFSGDAPPKKNNSKPQTRPARPSHAHKPSNSHAQSGPQSSAQYQPLGRDGYVVRGQLGTQEGTTMKLMQNKKTKELVAAKFIPRVQGAGLTKNTEREIVNHRKLLHPNIIRFKEVYMTDEHLVIVMEYASGGPLEERIATNGPLPEEEAKKFYRQLVDGMGYCHSQNIFHRDLRMDNLLLHGNFFESTIKISNFGYSKSSVLDSMAKTAAVGAPAYTPPELLLLAARSDGSAYDGAAIDVWASGIILYCMLTGSLPFLDPTEPNTINAKVMQRIVNGKYEFPKDRVPVTPECLDLIARIFTPDPAKRIKTEQIKQHPWLSGIPLPQEPPAIQAALQTEDDIMAVVSRARKRREERASSMQAPSSGQSADMSAAHATNGVGGPHRSQSHRSMHGQGPRRTGSDSHARHDDYYA